MTCVFEGIKELTRARKACVLLGSMEISGNTAETRVMEETGGGDGKEKGRKEGRKGEWWKGAA